MFRIGVKCFVAPRPLDALVPILLRIGNARLRRFVFMSLRRVSREA